MKKAALFVITLFINYFSTAQEPMISDRHLLTKLSFMTSLDFQGFSLPFSKAKTYLQNKGISLGVAYCYNTRKTLWQTIKAGVLFSPDRGSSRSLSTALQYIPLKSENLRVGISLGVGYMRTGISKSGWQQNEGEWMRTFNTQALFFAPAAIQVSITALKSNSITVAPTLSYQVNALLHYSPLTSITPQSLLSIGSIITFK